MREFFTLKLETDVGSHNVHETAKNQDRNTFELS